MKKNFSLGQHVQRKRIFGFTKASGYSWSVTAKANPLDEPYDSDIQTLSALVYRILVW